MAGTLRHRGPDDDGVWSDPNTGVAIAQTRLAIVDLTREGHQPMRSGCGRYVLVYNGELYNHRDIRRELGARTFRGTSDTEVLVEAISTWGVEASLSRLNGMFAFALWDRQAETLTLARDRLGEKPLYYGWDGTRFRFGSELKAMLAVEPRSPSIDRDALSLYFRYGVIPAPHTIYEGIRKLPAATVLTVSGRERTEPRPYWSAVDAAASGLSSPLPGSEHEQLDELEQLLLDSVERRMMSDVPLGALLSGGVDSSLIVGMMQSVSTAPVRTFTIGFREQAFDEAESARAVAAHLGTDHTDLLLTPGELLDTVPTLPRVYDEPFADSSQVPTMLVSALARQHVTVALSGDGGDEVFGGYARYQLNDRLWRAMHRVPGRARTTGASALRRISPAAWDRVIGPATRVLPGIAPQSRAGDKVVKLLNIADSRDEHELYRRMMSHTDQPTSIVLGASEPLTPLTDRDFAPHVVGMVDRMMLLDTVGYLPDDILTKVDRASMAASLEVRAPYLDHRVVELAWRLPPNLRAGDGRGKRCLRLLLDRYVPRPIVDRPKMGFGVPIEEWLRGPLRSWADDLLDPARLRAAGVLDVDVVTKLWSEHRRGARDWKYLIWDLLMFESWRDAWVSAPARAS